jgi:hypothetical protein
MIKKILLVLLALFVIIQFFRIDRDTPERQAENDFLVLTNAPSEVSVIMKNACYDCHSYETDYPWYSQIAPISWLLNDHVVEGREHLNFSEWGSYSAKKADHKLEECIEEVDEGEMPLKGYTLLHGDAKLSTEEKILLTDFFKSLRIE